MDKELAERCAAVIAALQIPDREARELAFKQARAAYKDTAMRLALESHTLKIRLFRREEKS
jgi:hypothetical protein